MRVRDCGIDELLNEAQFVLRDDGGLLARTLLRLFSFLYRRLHGLMLMALRHGWRSRVAAAGGR